MIWMQRHEESQPGEMSGMPRKGPRFAGWAIAGVLGIAVLTYLEAAVWVFCLFLVTWIYAAALWFERDAQRARVQVAATPPVTGSEPWTQWLDGWYWATDAQHRLVTLQSSSANPDGTDWEGLSELLSQKPVWWACWGDGGDSSRESLARLRHSMEHGLAWPGHLELPMSSTLRVLGGAEQVASCRLRGGPVRGADGTVTGFHGVLQWSASAGAGVPAGVPQAMSEAEQEALRYALSHDLRAPLRVVEGFTRIVKEDYGRFLDRVGHDHLERVLAASTRMNGMIDAILGQAQLAGTQVQREPVNLSTLAREVGSELALLVPACSPVSLVVADGMQVQADPALLRRVMENLIGNALKYSAKVAAPRVEVGVMPATDPPVYFVRDNGAGFDMQHADKLFGLFQRLHSAKDFPGTGVGLAGVQNIVRRHGGRVWAEARPGAGACFYFTLTDTAQNRQVPLRETA